MPKYYIHDGTEKTVIEADSPLQACFRAIKHRFDGVPINGYYRISEQGYEEHDEDVIFSADEVITALVDTIERSRKKKKDTKGEDFTDKKKKPRRRIKKDEEED